MHRLFMLALATWWLTTGCGNTEKVRVPGGEGRLKSAASVRASRRAFDGAPPVIPHQPFGAGCVACHTADGIEVPDVGFAPPMPHATTGGMSAISRCEQCHLWRQTDDLFTQSSFRGLTQDLRHGERQSDTAPPRIPHQVFMRENCLACHSGKAAREEIRTSHPERARCQQCHVPIRSRSTFISALTAASAP